MYKKHTDIINKNIFFQVKEKELPMSLSFGENQKSLCLQMCAASLWAPLTVSTLRDGLPAYPTHSEGGEAESAAAAEDAALRGETSPSVCLPVWSSRETCLEVGEARRPFSLCQQLT